MNETGEKKQGEEGGAAAEKESHVEGLVEEPSRREIASGNDDRL